MKKVHLLIIAILVATSAFAGGYITPPTHFHRYQVTHQRNTLPDAYDTRTNNVVLAPRDQQIEGTCWAFAVTDALQVLYYKNNIETGYLSPQSFATCFTGFNVAPITEGGNEQMAGSMMARLEGIVTEEALPYAPNNAACVSFDKKNTPMYTLGWNLLPADDATAIKQNIMEYGSVTASFYYHRNYYNKTTGIYEYTGDNGVNHGITLIGWDDSKQAWLAKNNWGIYQFDNGYLWISYKDKLIASECVAYTDCTPTESIDRVYHYNSTGMVGTFGLDISGILTDAIVQFDFEGNEQLVAIGTYVTEPGTKLSFTVITNDWQQPYISDSVTIAYKGFYKHVLPTPLPIAGKNYVAVTAIHPTEGYVIPIECTIPDYTQITPKENKQWVAFDNSDWMPLGKGTEYPYNLCIYAYTKKGTTNGINTPVDYDKVFDGSSILSSAWESVKSIRLYHINGKLIKTLTEQDDRLSDISEGVYILSVDRKDGTTYGEKIVYQPK